MEHILVVEDEKEIAEAIQIYLEEEGYQVTICLESKNAMEIIQKQNIKLALLDVMMPNIDGITLARKIRKVSNIPIIFVFFYLSITKHHTKVLFKNILLYVY